MGGIICPPPPPDGVIHRPPPVRVLKVEQRFWYHRICLVEAHSTIYKTTSKGQGQSLTSGQVRPRSRDDWNGSYCISVDLPGQDERTDTNLMSLSFLIKSYWQMTVGDLGWPQMTFRGVGNANFYWNCPQLSYTIWLHSNRLAPK